MPLCSYYAVENETHFVLECPLYNPIKDKFPPLLKSIVSKEPEVFLSI